MRHLFALCLALTTPLLPVAAAPARTSTEQQADGVVLPVHGTFLKLQVRADNIIHVESAKDPKFFRHSSLILAPQNTPGPHMRWRLVRGPQGVTLATASLQARVNLVTGTVSFFDAAGRPILAERTGGRRLEPAQVQGERTFHVQQQWASNADESLYGLGQRQLGIVNIKGYDLDLWQHNTNVVVPFLVSSRGYGILWDNTSYTRFGDLRPLTPIPAAQLSDADGKPGGLTGSYYSDAHFGTRVAQQTDPAIDIHQSDRPPAGGAGTAAGAAPAAPVSPFPRRGDASVRWEGTVTPTQTGTYTFQAFSNGGIKFWADGRMLMDHWRQSWLPSDDVAHVRLQAGKPCRVKLEWTRDQGANTVRLLWKTPPADASPPTSLWSEVGDGVDYDFVYGPSLDRVVAGYRRLTGRAPMMPLWAYGLWQSRQRYETQQQSLDAVDGFRARGIPFDNIVQDWFYWPADAWGSHQFDPQRFPDPTGWIKAIHDRHAHLMISVWGKFYPGTANFDAMHARGYLYEPNLTEKLRDWVGYPYTFYDPFSPAARHLFWSQIDTALFQKNVDAWWMDASEPDLLALPSLEGNHTHMTPTAGGTPARILNGWALENSRGIYEGQRAAAPDQRVFILTRSGFAGQQRYATATWSGDITSTWTALRKQIPAGLGFSLSGVPYWTMDTGGFSVPARFASRNADPKDTDEWRELNARWFEYATFVPLLRVHGEFPHREMWEFGGDTSPTYQAELKFDRLRYRMLPYLYSLAGAVTQDGGTMMRPLVMDFRTDRQARDITDQYLFGPAFLVSPVTTYGARSRSVYLPATPGGWYDFWTGAALPGGRAVVAPAAFDSMPLHIRAGAIIPFGPDQQYAGEKKADSITLFVYTGANGQFSLYEDDGLTNAYERGAFSRIPIHWDDATKTLAIGKRAGVFPGMPTQRTFNIVLVSRARPVGYSSAPRPDRVVHYHGDTVQAKF